MPRHWSLATKSDTALFDLGPKIAAALAAHPLVITAGASADNRSIEKYVEKLAYSSNGSVLAGVGVGFALRIYDPRRWR